MAGDGLKVKQRQNLCHHGDTICHPKSGYVTTKLHGTSRPTCRCNNKAIFSDSYFQVSCRLRMPATLTWPQQSLGSSCQTGKMAALLNSLFLIIYIIQLLHAGTVPLAPPRASHGTLRKLVTMMSACSGRNYNFRCTNVVFWRVFARVSANSV